MIIVRFSNTLMSRYVALDIDSIIEAEFLIKNAINVAKTKLDPPMKSFLTIDIGDHKINIATSKSYKIFTLDEFIKEHFVDHNAEELPF